VVCYLQRLCEEVAISLQGFYLVKCGNNYENRLQGCHREIANRALRGYTMCKGGVNGRI